MNNLIELKEFFIGSGPQQRQTSWVCPIKEPFLEINDLVVEDHQTPIMIDFGSLSPLAPGHKTIPVTNLTQQSVLLSIDHTDPHIVAQWSNQTPEILLNNSDNMAELQLTFLGGIMEDQVLDIPLSLKAEMDSGATKEYLLQLHIQINIDVPYTDYCFNGHPFPFPHDFGKLDPMSADCQNTPPYTVTFHNLGKETLECSLLPLPGWLHIEVDTQPIITANSTFKTTPGQLSTLTFRPRAALEFLGPQQGYVQITTNDSRAQYQQLDCQFSLNLEIQGPYVTLADPVYLDVLAEEKKEFTLPLLNWGNNLARIIHPQTTGPIYIKDETVIPQAKLGKPQPMALQAVFSSAGFAPGAQKLDIELFLENSHMSNLVFPIEISVIKLVAEPPIIDFGEVEPETGYSKTIHLLATDGRALNLWAKPVRELSLCLKASTTDNNTLEISFRLPANTAKSFLPEFSGPGIHIFEMNLKSGFMLPVTFKAASPAIGVLCPNCHLVSEPDLPFCSACGTDLKKAPPISGDKVVHCPTCPRVFGTILKFCPVDGSPLT